MYDRLLEAIKKLKEEQDKNTFNLEALKKEVEEKSSLNMQKALIAVADDLGKYAIEDGYWYYNGTNTGIKAEGIDGRDGDIGPQGLPGKDGKDGKQGLPGKNGKDGARGPQGLPGKDGKDGKDGRDGKDGKDGISPILKIGKVETSPEYGGALAKLRPGKDGILYLDLTLPRGPQGFTGFDGKDAKINGVNSLNIEAGENITIDQQGNTLTINSTGGGGGDYEDLENLPTINNVELKGNKTTSDLGIEIPDVSNFITKDVDDLTYYYTKTEVDSKLSAVYKYKGSVASYSNLPSTGLTVGDVYNVEDTGDNYAWTGAAWDKLSGIVDLSGYQTKIDSTHKLSADLISDGSTNKTVTVSEKTTWSGKQDKLVAGTNISIASDGKTISATDTTYSDATTNASGLMSASDKTKLNGIASGAEVNVQANWNETNTSSDAYIQNKPTNVSAFTNDAGYTTNTGTITGITMNGSSKGTSGVVDLGTVVTSHQDISGKLDTSKVKNANSTTAGDVYDVRYINTMLGNVESLLSEV